jgi:hypothetical protein
VWASLTQPAAAVTGVIEGVQAGVGEQGGCRSVARGSSSTAVPVAAPVGRVSHSQIIELIADRIDSIASPSRVDRSENVDPTPLQIGLFGPTRRVDGSHRPGRTTVVVTHVDRTSAPACGHEPVHRPARSPFDRPQTSLPRPLDSSRTTHKPVFYKRNTCSSLPCDRHCAREDPRSHCPTTSIASSCGLDPPTHRLAGSDDATALSRPTNPGLWDVRPGSCSPQV